MTIRLTAMVHADLLASLGRDPFAARVSLTAHRIGRTARLISLTGEATEVEAAARTLSIGPAEELGRSDEGDADCRLAVMAGTDALVTRLAGDRASCGMTFIGPVGSLAGAHPAPVVRSSPELAALGMECVSETAIDACCSRARPDRAGWVLAAVPGYVGDPALLNIAACFDRLRFRFILRCNDLLDRVPWLALFGARMDETPRTTRAFIAYRSDAFGELDRPGQDLEELMCDIRI